MRKRILSIVFLAMFLALLPGEPAVAQAAVADQVAAMAFHANEGAEAVTANDPVVIQREVMELQAFWGAIEDGVQEQNPTAYVELEEALHALTAAAAETPLDASKVGVAFIHMGDKSLEMAVLLRGAPATTTVDVPQSLPELLDRVDALYAAAEAGDVDASGRLLRGVVLAWPVLEGAVAAKSPAAYDAIELELGHASAVLRAQPVDWGMLEQSAEVMRAQLAPLLDTQAYTAFDAGAIILREGLEALLVVAALLTFLRRSNNSDKQRWVWIGAGVGVLLSLGVAVLLQAIFSQVAAGRNREIIEGVTGLVAAAMLFYVSHWLHSKSSLSGWRGYIDANTTRALARGNLIGLAFLAMIAIFREGAETAVFYLGIAPAIAMPDLLLGIGAGLAILGVAAWLILAAGVKLPLRFFFQVAGLLVFYLGFKFVGTGLHALQVAGVVSATPIPWLPPIPFFGIYPTWETLIPQLAILVVGIGAYGYGRWRDRQHYAAVAAEAQTA